MGDFKVYPVILLVNYWEISHSEIENRLNAIEKLGVKQLIAFIPWQLAESDVSYGQTLTRFLQNSVERKISIYLIVTPELGIPLPHSSFPKDLILNEANQAHHWDLGCIPIIMAPQIFNLPSFFSPQVVKRYYSYLGRLGQLFSDLFKNQPKLFNAVTVVVTGSFWKYYQSPFLNSRSLYRGIGGDFSSQAVSPYRQCMDQFFSQKEFMSPTSSASQEWRARSFEEINRRWFYQYSEDAFRYKSVHHLKKKLDSLKMKEFEIFTPDAEPEISYSHFFQMLSGLKMDFKKFSHLLERSALKMASGSNAAAFPFIHWSSVGALSAFSEPQRQFLILKSLLLFGSRNGGIILSDEQWIELDNPFRSRVEILAQALAEGDFQLNAQILYLSPHLWSEPGFLWNELVRLSNFRIQMVSTRELVLSNQTARLLVVDAAVIFTHDLIQQLIDWAKAGRVVMISESQLYSASARELLDRLLAKIQKIQVDIGVSYELFNFGNGKFLVTKIPFGALHFQNSTFLPWQHFLTSLFSLSAIENHFRLTDARLTLIPMEGKQSKMTAKSGIEGLVLFILNATSESISSEIIFSKKVQLKNLEDFYKEKSVPNVDGTEILFKNRFLIEVPAFGLISLFVDGLDLVTSRENQFAALNSEQTKRNALEVAEEELLGLKEMKKGIDDLWS